MKIVSARLEIAPRGKDSGPGNAPRPHRKHRVGIHKSDLHGLAKCAISIVCGVAVCP